jgi:hypothetical protein
MIKKLKKYIKDASGDDYNLSPQPDQIAVAKPRIIT